MLDGGLCCDFSLLFETVYGLPGNGAVPEVKQNARERLFRGNGMWDEDMDIFLQMNINIYS